MKNILLKFIFTCAFSLYLIYTLEAQPTVTRIEDYRDRYPWLQTANPAGLLFNAASPFSIAEASYYFTDGNMRMATEAASLHRFRIQAESYRRFKRIQLHGRIGYENSSQKSRQWQTTLQPEAHLINFGDTVAGRQTIETYNICAGLSLPLGSGWHVGSNLDYYARSGRKHIDPRNQNDQIDLTVVPGVLYLNKGFGIGAHFSYQRIMEKISYSIFNGEDYNGRTFYPLWFGISENFRSGTNSTRSYQEERFGGALQLWEKRRRYEWLSEFCYKKGVERCDIMKETASQAGETERQELNWSGLLRFSGNQHTFRPAYQRLVRIGYDNLQSLPENMTGQSYLQHGRAKRSAVINDNISLDYTLLFIRDSLSGYQKIKTCVEWLREQTQFFIYPATFKQTIQYVAFTANYTRQINMRRQAVGIMAEITYRNGNGHLPELRSENEYPLPEINIFQKKDLLINDFTIRTAETIHYSAEIQYTRYLNRSYAFFSSATVSYLQGLSQPCRSKSRLHCGVSAGFLF